MQSCDRKYQHPETSAGLLLRAGQHLPTNIHAQRHEGTDVSKMAVVALALCFALALASCGSEDREEADRAYRALKELQGKVETGINYEDYGRAVGTAAGTVNIYLERGKKDSVLYKAISRAMENYKEAKTPWDIKVSRYEAGGMARYLPDDDDSSGALLSQLKGEPGVDPSYSEVEVMLGGSPYPVRFEDHKGEVTWDLDSVTQVHWALADIEMAKAAAELK